MPAPAAGEVVAWSLGGVSILSRVPSGTAIFGLLPVVAATIGSALLMWVVSIATPPPARETIGRYFTQS